MAFTFGIGHETYKPGDRDVFQWYAEIDDRGGVQVHVAFREFDPSVASMGGPYFPQTQYTMMSLIRSYFVTAARLSLESVVKNYNEQRKTMFATMFKVHDAERASATIDFFDTVVEYNNAAEKGNLLLEPFNARKTDPPTVLSGAMFPVQGDRSAKRVRLTMETENGIVPVAVGNTADFRMLAGDVKLGSPEMYNIIAAFSNCYPSDVQVGEHLFVPTILRRRDLVDITHKITGNTHGVLLPLYSERVIEEINKLVHERKAEVTAQYTINLLVGTVRTCTVGDVEDNNLQDMITAVNMLRDDPILFVKGPPLKYESSDRGNMVVTGDPDVLLPCFDVHALSRYGAVDARKYYTWSEDPENPQDGMAYATPFCDVYDDGVWRAADEADIRHRQASIMNTLFNLLRNTQAGMTVRLSDWERAQVYTETYKTVPVVDANPTREFSAVQAPWHSTMAVQDRDRQYRLDLMGNPEAGVDKTEVDFDSPMKEFELDRHLADKDTHVADAMSVAAMALQMIFSKHTEPSVTIPMQTVFRRDTHDSLVPFKRDTMNITRASNAHGIILQSTTGENVISALSAFLYEHATLQATSPLSSHARAPAYEEIKALIESVDPFPMTHHVYEHCKPAVTLLQEGLKKAFEDCIYLLQDTRTQIRPGVQPIAPGFVTYDQVGSGSGWCVGAEATPVIEATMLALHTIKDFGDKATLRMHGTGAAATPMETLVIEKDTPIRVDPAKDLAEMVDRSHRSTEKSHVYTFPGIEGYWDCRSYARELGLKYSWMYLQSGRAVFASTAEVDRGEGYVGFFHVSDGPMYHCLNAKDIAGLKVGFEVDNIRVKGVKNNYGGFFRDGVLLPFSEFPRGHISNAFEDENLHVVGGKFEKYNNWPYLCYETDTIVDRIDQLEEGVREYGNITGDKNKPIFFCDDDSYELVGVAIFSELVVSLYAEIKLESVLESIVCYNSKYLFRMHERGNRVYYGFSKDMFVSPNITILKHTPLLWTSVTTAAAYASDKTRPLTSPDKLPYKFYQGTFATNVTDIAKRLVENFQGMHYSNTKALSKTVFAGVVQTKRQILYDYLTQQDPRYNKSKKISWAIDMNSGTAMSVIIGTLHNAYEQTGRLIQEAPLVSPVIVVVRGPSAADMGTPCIVQNWFYKTGTYMSVETTLIDRMYTVLRDTWGYPPGSTERCLAKLMRGPSAPRSVDALVTARPDLASAFASLLIEEYENEKVRHTSAKARSLAVLEMARKTLARKVSDILFFV